MDGTRGSAGVRNVNAAQRFAGILLLFAVQVVPGCDRPSPDATGGSGLYLLPLSPTADTWINANVPDANYEHDTLLLVNDTSSAIVPGEPIEVTLLRFESQAVRDGAPSPDPSTVHAAELALWVDLTTPHSPPYACAPAGYDVHRIMRHWTENGATWHCADDPAPNDPLPDTDCTLANQWNPREHGDTTFQDSPIAHATCETLSDGRTRIVFDVTEDVRTMFDTSTAHEGWAVIETVSTHTGPAETAFPSTRVISGSPELTVTYVTDDYQPPDDLPAPPLDRSTVTSVWPAYRYLIESATPIQWAVADGAIDPERATLLRGFVRDHSASTAPPHIDAAPIRGATITVLGHEGDYGRTRSLSDGSFRLLVNGGESLVIRIEMPGYLPAQRRIYVPYNTQVAVDDVHLLTEPPLASCVRIDATNRVASVSTESDARGTRSLTAYVPAGVEVTGAGQPTGLDTFWLCAREYSTEPRGPDGAGVGDGELAMPGELPPSSSFTFAAKVQVRRDASGVPGAEVLDPEFTGSGVNFWVNNFLDIQVGTQIPNAWYDEAAARWVPLPDGRVLQVSRDSAGVCSYSAGGPTDATESGICATLGVAPGASASFWRVPGIHHFSALDFNWARVIDVVVGALETAAGYVAWLCGGAASTVSCDTQAVREDLPITSIPFGLSYSSDRQAGRRDAYSVTVVPLPERVPSGLESIQVELHVAGRVFTAAADPTRVGGRVNIVWDGVDAEGRRPIGPQPGSVRIGYVYNTRYTTPPPDSDVTFGEGVGAAIESIDPRNRRIRVWESYEVSVGLVDDRLAGIGGWSLDAHHFYDPNQHMVHLGDGRTIDAEDSGAVSRLIGAGLPTRPVIAVAGTATGGVVYATNDDGSGIPNPGVYEMARAEALSETYLCSTTAAFRITDVAVDDSGITSVYYISIDGPGACVHRLGPAERGGGTPTCASLPVVLGTCDDAGEFNVDPDFELTRGLAAATAMHLADIPEIAVGPDGVLFAAEPQRERVLRVAVDGTARLALGRPESCSGADRPSCHAIHVPNAVAVAPDGTLYVGHHTVDGVTGRIERVDPGGREVRTIIGVLTDRQDSISGRPDGILGTDARVDEIQGMVVDSDGTLIYAESSEPHNLVRSLGRDARVRTMAGQRVDLPFGFPTGDGSAATLTEILELADVGVLPNGNILYVDANGARRPRVVTPRFPGGRSANHLVSAPDGSQLWEFDPNGRHLRTTDPLTGATLASFTYTPDGHLRQAFDDEGRTLRIDWPGDEAAPTTDDTSGTVLLSAGGRSTTIVVDAGYTTSASYARAEADHGQDTYHFDMTSSGAGLLSYFTDPDGDIHQMSFDTLGRLENAFTEGTDTRSQFLSSACPGASDCAEGERRIIRTSGSSADAVATTFGSHFDGNTFRRRTVTPAGVVVLTDIPRDGYSTTTAFCVASGDPCSCSLTTPPDGSCMTAPLATSTTSYLADPRPDHAGERYATSSFMTWPDVPGGAQPTTLTSQRSFRDGYWCAGAANCFEVHSTVGSGAETVTIIEPVPARDDEWQMVHAAAGESVPATATERANPPIDRRIWRTVLDRNGNPIEVHAPGRQPACIAYDGTHVAAIRHGSGPDCSGGTVRTSRFTRDPSTRYLLSTVFGNGGSGTVTTTFQPNLRGWPTSVHLPAGTGPAATVQFGYDGEAFIRSIVVPSGNELGPDLLRRREWA